MKPRLLCILCVLSSFNFCKAQEVTMELDTSMFDPYFQTISLPKLNGWIFRQGYDTAWSAVNIDTTGWRTVHPALLSAKDADKSGKLEGWLRLKFKLDASFESIPLGILASRWVASDIYLDGNYIRSYGSTGQMGTPYEENRNLFLDIQPLHIETGKEHVLAIHIVDYTAPFNHQFLKTESLYNNFDTFIELTGPSAYKKATAYIRDSNGSSLLFTGVLGFLTILFWFLYLQNRRDKNLLLVAISTSFYFLWALLIAISLVYPFDISFNQWWIIFFVAFQCWPLAIASMIYTVGRIFTFKYPVVLLIFGIAFVIYSILGSYFDFGRFDIHPISALALTLYILFSSWRKLKGAQWAVVAGVIATIVFSFLWAYSFTKYDSLVFPLSYIYESGEYLSFPLSLMIYVAMRFKEILTDVEVNAKQVMKLSEEKKEQAERQQKVLEVEVAKQTIELRTSLEHLKATQAQLIQAEKMASLGQLTAGIAHEIQNPLNFVNNFSEVNNELIGELRSDNGKSEREKGKGEKESELLQDIYTNNEKIILHGKRADAIVKNMLEHSRQGTGEKELTDINALADEYLKLAYNSMQAKDKDFNSAIRMEFDDGIGKMNIVAQDIGRVLLNLYNNAFYAVREKAMSGKVRSSPVEPGQIAESGGPFEPEVSVSTKKTDYQVAITVKDNGNGIPVTVIDKIFQPFFTTKPTGQGTGLGLSLAYDIVKAHGGELKADSKPGEGSEFIVQLPIAY